MSNSTSSRRQLVQYIAAAVLGGYAFTWGFIAFGIASLFALGMEFHDAESLASILGFIVFLVVFLWTFTVRSLRRIWLTLAGGGALMAGAASLIQLTLVSSP
jgi:hypothetical protein